MKYTLLLLLSFTAFSREECRQQKTETNPNLQDIQRVMDSYGKCKKEHLKVTAICQAKDANGTMALWSVENKSSGECKNKSKFNHGPKKHNLPKSFNKGVSYICGAYWDSEDVELEIECDDNEREDEKKSLVQCNATQLAQLKKLCNFDPLPITLISFTAVANQQSSCVDVQFKTALETNADKVIIEKSSDGVTFQSVGEVASTNPQGGSYQYQDCKGISKGLSYYRLRQRDKDGKEEVFNTISVNTDGIKVNTKLYPNPAYEEVNVDFDSTGLSSVSYQIINLSGQVMGQESVSISAGQSSFKIPLQNVVPGQYIIKLIDQNGQEIAQSKLLKQ